MERFYQGKKIDGKLQKICPAAYAEIEKASTHNQNLQSAVLSECAYAQTLANILDLCNFVDYIKDHECPK